MDYYALYLRALTAYIHKRPRVPLSRVQHARVLQYRYEWYDRLIHSHSEYAEIHSLRRALRRETSEPMQRLEVKMHFMLSFHRWRLYSFNNYLLEEIRKNSTNEEWNKHWKHYDQHPIYYHKGLLYKTTHLPPQMVFSHGIYERRTSHSINDYLEDSNEMVGVSTSRLFSIARDEAQHNPWYARLFSRPPPSYIYVIDYQGDDAIHLALTLEINEHSWAAGHAKDKEKVNILQGIPGNRFIGAFKVSHSPLAKTWLRNPHYAGNTEFISELSPDYQQLVTAQRFSRAYFST